MNTHNNTAPPHMSTDSRSHPIASEAVGFASRNQNGKKRRVGSNSGNSAGIVMSPPAKRSATAQGSSQKPNQSASHVQYEPVNESIFFDKSIDEAMAVEKSDKPDKPDSHSSTSSSWDPTLLATPSTQEWIPPSSTPLPPAPEPVQPQVIHIYHNCNFQTYNFKSE